MQDPENVRGVKDLLGHADFATTEKYYIMAQSRLAGRHLGRIMTGLRNRRAGQKPPASESPRRLSEQRIRRGSRRG